MSNHEIEEDRIRWRIDFAKYVIACVAIDAVDTLKRCKHLLREDTSERDWRRIDSLLYAVLEHQRLLAGLRSDEEAVS